MHAAGVGHTLADQVFHFPQITQQFVALSRVVHKLGAQFHASNGGLQIVGNGCENLHALFEVVCDALLHGIKGHGGMGDLGRAAFVQMLDAGIRVQAFYRA